MVPAATDDRRRSGGGIGVLPLIPLIAAGVVGRADRLKRGGIGVLPPITLIESFYFYFSGTDH